MNREDIIKMAQEAGLQCNGYWEFDLVRLERFAQLVAAQAKREVLLEAAERLELVDVRARWSELSPEKQLRQMATLIAAHERKACAKVCKDADAEIADAEVLAERIRARSEK
jgi:hypothetical protein